MKIRHVFSARDVPLARQAVDTLRQAGLAEEDISLIARADIELEAISDQHKVTAGDFYPAAIRGAVGGGAAGLLAGIVAVVAAPIGLTLAGVGALALAGAAVGSWATALAGSAVPDPVSRKFQDEINAGRILLVLDGDKETLARVEPALERLGLERLPFESKTVMTMSH
jgi:hypothetical protein